MRILLFLVLLGSSLLHAQTVSFTFDDGLDPRANAQAATWNAAILSALAAADVKAAIFPAGRIVDSPAGIDLVRAWGLAGHVIGNHTYSHANLGSSKVSIAAFVGDVQRQHALLDQLPGWANMLRFPYLKEGDTASKRDAVYRWLSDHGYQAAPVSIDTSDWYYNERYAAWLTANPGADPASFRRAYLDHILDRAHYYDSLALRILHRRPAHVLLLHTNQINAAFLPQLIARFRDKGWKIVSPADAFADPLYSSRPDTLPAGESIVWSLAKQHGETGLRYPAEDGDYEEAKLDALHL